jgi:hypothetical protein
VLLAPGSGAEAGAEYLGTEWRRQADDSEERTWRRGSGSRQSRAAQRAVQCGARACGQLYPLSESSAGPGGVGGSRGSGESDRPRWRNCSGMASGEAILITQLHTLAVAVVFSATYSVHTGQSLQRNLARCRARTIYLGRSSQSLSRPASGIADMASGRRAVNAGVIAQAQAQAQAGTAEHVSTAESSCTPHSALDSTRLHAKHGAVF